MAEELLQRLLGTSGRDSGCDGAFEVLDQYVEAVRRAAHVQVDHSDFVTHIQNCAACREDTEGLLAALDVLEPPPGK